MSERGAFEDLVVENLTKAVRLLEEIFTELKTLNANTAIVASKTGDVAQNTLRIAAQTAKPAPPAPIKAEKPEDLKPILGPDYMTALHVGEEGDHAELIAVTPVKYLGTEKWRQIADALAPLDPEWISEGINSRWRIKKRT